MENFFSNDAPEDIGFGVTISAPHMHAYTLEFLKDHLIEGATALDVGSGSGYLTACMGHMVGPKGKVYGIDHIPELVEISKRNIEKDSPDLLTSGRVKLIGQYFKQVIITNMNQLHVKIYLLTIFFLLDIQLVVVVKSQSRSTI